MGSMRTVLHGVDSGLNGRVGCALPIPPDTHSFPELSSELSTTGVSHTSRWMLVSGQVYEALGDLRACVEVTARRVPSGAHHTNPRHSQQFAKLS